MAYANKYLFRFASAAGKDISIYVQQDGFTGTVTQRPLGQAPVLKKEKNGPVCGTSLTFYPECHVDQEFAEFYTSDPKEYKVRVLIGSTVTWEGYVTPELYAEPDIAPPYDVEVVATDGLGELKLHEYEAQGLQTLRAQLVYLLGLTGLGTTVYISSELSVTAQSVVSAGGLLDGVKVNLDYMEGESCYDVLTAILDTLHAEIMHHRGAWLVSRETDLTITGGKVEYYNTAGTKSTFANSVKTEGKMGVADMWPVGKLTTRVEPAKNQITVQAPWHPATAIANPYMTSDTGWTKLNGTTYDSTVKAYKLPYTSVGEPAYITQDIALGGMNTSMAASIRFVGYAGHIDGYAGIAAQYTTGGTTYSLVQNRNGDLEWKAGGQSDMFVWKSPVGAVDGDRNNAGSFDFTIPAFYRNSTFPAGTLKLVIWGNAAYICGASLDVVVPYGWQDVLTLTNDARGAGDTAEIFIGKETTAISNYKAFLQGIALTATGSNLCTSWSDKRWSNLDFLALTSRGYALSVAAPRLNSTGTLQVPNLTYIPLVIAEGSINFWLREWTWNLLEDELEIDAISLPSATLTVSDETVEAMGGTAQSSTSSGSTGGGGGTGSGHTHDNKEVLDGITAEKVEGWDDAAEKAHTHSNKVLLDSYTQTEANLASAVSQKHTHSNRDAIDLFRYDASNNLVYLGDANNPINFAAYGDVAAGGNGGGGTGGGGVLYKLNDIYHNDSSVLRADGTVKQAGDALVYNSTLGKWVAAAVGSGSGTVTQVKVGSTAYNPVDGVVTLPAYPSYSLPTASANTLGGIKIGASVTGKNYAVQLDANNKAYVNVPWENTTYNDATTSAHGLMTAAMVTKLNGIATGATAVSSSTVLGWGFVKSVASKTPDSSGNVALSASDVKAIGVGDGSNINWTNAASLQGNRLTGYADTSTSGRWTSYATILQFSNVANPIPGTSQHWLTQIWSGTEEQLGIRWRTNTGAWSSMKTIYHSGNLTASTIAGWGFAYSTALNSYLPLSGGTMTGDITLPSEQSNWNFSVGDSKVRLITSRGTAATGAPGTYYGGLSAISGYVGFQLVVGGGGGEDLKFRKLQDNGTWHAWNTIYHSGNANNTSTAWACSTLAMGNTLTMSGDEVLFAASTNLYINRGLQTRTVDFFGTSVRFRNTGNVGIGTTDPVYKLDLVGSSRFVGDMIANNSYVSIGHSVYNTGGLAATLMFNGFTATSPNFRCGKINYYANSYSYFQKIEFASRNDSGDTALAWIDASGNFTAIGEVSAGSDRRWKDNIDYSINGVEVIKALRPATWDWKEGHGDGKSAGLIAQDVMGVLPYAVKGSEEAGYTLNYNTVLGFSVKAIQEHESEIDRLRWRVTELESEIKRLRS